MHSGFPTEDTWHTHISAAPCALGSSVQTQGSPTMSDVPIAPVVLQRHSSAGIGCRRWCSLPRSENLRATWGNTYMTMKLHIIQQNPTYIVVHRATTITKRTNRTGSSAVEQGWTGSSGPFFWWEVRQGGGETLKNCRKGGDIHENEPVEFTLPVHIEALDCHRHKNYWGILMEEPLALCGCRFFSSTMDPLIKGTTWGDTNRWVKN